MLGISNAVEFSTERIGPVKSLVYGFQETWFFTALVAKTAKMVITGEESVKNLGGPLQIAKFTEESRKSGLDTLLRFMAFLSLNLGFMNLLPIPVLDGGHLMILTAEGFARREIPIKAKLVIQQVGLALILMLMVVIFYNDIVRMVASG